MGCYMPFPSSALEYPGPAGQNKYDIKKVEPSMYTLFLDSRVSTP